MFLKRHGVACAASVLILLTAPAVAQTAVEPAVKSTVKPAVPVHKKKPVHAEGGSIAAKARAVHAAKPAITKKPIRPAKKAKSKNVVKPAGPIPLDPAIEGIAQPHLTGDAAWSRMVGNSITGTFDGQPLTEGYLADGTVKTRMGGDSMQGRWGVVEGKICFQYPPETQAACYGLELDGHDVAYTAPDGTVSRFVLQTGVPGDL